MVSSSPRPGHGPLCGLPRWERAGGVRPLGGGWVEAGLVWKWWRGWRARRCRTIAAVGLISGLLYKRGRLLKLASKIGRGGR